MPYNIYSEIKQYYINCRLFTKIFIWARCRIAPFEKIIKYIPEKGNVVDIGCGYGMFSNYLSLKRPHCNIFGTDFKKECIDENNKTIGNRKNIKYECIDVKDLKLNSCDVICMIDLMHHIDFNKQEKLLKECYKKLKKGGILIFKEIDTKPLWRISCNTIHDTIMNPGKKLYYKSSEEYCDLLQNIGFVLKKKENMYKAYLSHYLLEMQK